MINPNCKRNSRSGKNMTRYFLRVALAAAALASVSSSVLAADIDPPPPPVQDLRPATYDWSGPYLGAFIAGIGTEGHYDKVPDCAPGLPGCGPESSLLFRHLFRPGLR